MIDQALSIVRGIVSAEREAGYINSLDDLTARTIRRTTITQLWTQIQSELAPMQQAIKDLPALPPRDQIAWAQTVVAMPGLRLLEIDTTGLGNEDEICRVTLGDSGGQVVFDCYIRPTRRPLTDQASRANGIQPGDLEQAPTIEQAWERIERALRGTYVVSFNQEWDLKQLASEANRHQLTPIVVIGECLQRRLTQYYHKEYSLTLAEITERMTGTPLAEPATATARIAAQSAILSGMAAAVTNRRQPRPSRAHPEQPVDLFVAQSDLDDGLGDIDEHPF